MNVDRDAHSLVRVVLLFQDRGHMTRISRARPFSTATLDPAPANTLERSSAAEQEATRRPRPRIESLGDLIFGLSLAIDSIALVPTGATTTDQMNQRILIFAFAFLFLIKIGRAHV